MSHVASYVQATDGSGGVDIRLFAEMKPNVTTRVEHLYHFKTSKAPHSIQSNAELAKMLLKDMNFIYHVRPRFCFASAQNTLTPFRQ